MGQDETWDERVKRDPSAANMNTADIMKSWSAEIKRLRDSGDKRGIAIIDYRTTPPTMIQIPAVDDKQVGP